MLDTSIVGATSGQMIIHWMWANDAPADFYQAANYTFDASSSLLKIQWGEEEPSLEEALASSLPDSDSAVNGTDVVQYKQDGFYSASIYGLN